MQRPQLEINVPMSSSNSHVNLMSALADERATYTGTGVPIERSSMMPTEPYIADSPTHVSQ